MVFGRTATLIGVTAVVLAGPEPARANDLCARLEARLASVERAAGAYWNDGSRALDAALDRQQRALDQATAKARRAGCGGIRLFVKRGAAARCGSLLAQRDRLRAEVNRLQAQRRSLAANPHAGDQERSELLRALAANNCGQRYAVDRSRRRGSGFFASLLGGRRFFPGRRNEGFGHGTYRTLCVRSCDGYYFPISFSAVASQFSQDQQVCRALCPGRDVALYVHRNPGEEAGQMVSLVGEPYVALPNAFRYRREYDASCKCGPVTAEAAALFDANATAVFADTGATEVAFLAAPATVAGVPAPRSRPTGSVDPETAANRAGLLRPMAGPTLSPAETVITVGPDGGRIRVVGPSFLATR